MAIRVEAYTAAGIVTGTIRSPGHLRDTLEAAPRVAIDAATFAPLDGRAPSLPSDRSLPIDDLIVAASDESFPGPVHAAWHAVVIEAGPYRVEGELATLPGFDPGRALTRPTGQFVHLRGVVVTLLGRPEAGRATYPDGLVNRYLVDVVESDIMLGFFFPGARMDGPGALPAPREPAASPAAVAPPPDATNPNAPDPGLTPGPVSVPAPTA